MQNRIEEWLERFATERAANPELDLEDFLANADEDIRDELRNRIDEPTLTVNPKKDALAGTRLFSGFGDDLEFDTNDPAKEMIDNYKLLQVIGEGGMGTVYLAEQTQPVRRRVALKIIKLGMDTKEVVARFESERQALSMMDHPNIAKVLDVGSTKTGRPYFVMELVRGLPFTKFCDEYKLSVKERLDLFCSVCNGVNHAHQR